MIRLQELAKDIQGGTSATVVLLQKNGLYVSNVGDTRALLCTKDAAGGFHYEQVCFLKGIPQKKSGYR